MLTVIYYLIQICKRINKNKKNSTGVRKKRLRFLSTPRKAFSPADIRSKTNLMLKFIFNLVSAIALVRACILIFAKISNNPKFTALKVKKLVSRNKKIKPLFILNNMSVYLNAKIIIWVITTNLSRFHTLK